jgi:autotransporter-associated beta strand protein
LTLNDATILTTASLANSEIIVPAGSTSTIQGDGATGLGGAVNINSLSGDGTLTLTSTVDDKAFATGVTGNFTGVLNVQPTAPAALLGAVRIRGGQTNLPNAVVNLTAARLSNQQGGAVGGTATFQLGEIHADAASGLTSFEGGGTAQHANWEIGGLGTDSEILGPIADNAAMAPTALSNVTKVGGGALTLGGTNTYTGLTDVQDGILTTTHSGVFADGSNLNIATGAEVTLDFAGTDTINALFFSGSAQPIGTYGALGSGATNIRDDFFNGMGVLNVLAMLPDMILIGDYNDNGVVDAADYTVWRDSLGTGFVLPNRDPANMGNVSADDYTSWVNNFGATAGAASGGAAGAQGGVPEPSSLVLILGMLVGLSGIARRRNKSTLHS